MIPALLLALLGCRPATDDVPAAVIVLVLDGVRTQESFGEGASDAAGTDHPSEVLPESWARLVPYGVRATAALNLGSTLTAPAHVAIATGRRRPFGNYDVLDEDPGFYRPELPSLMEVFRGRRGLARDRVSLDGNTVLTKPVAHSLWPMDGYDHGADFGLVYDDGYASEDVPSQDDVVTLRAIKERILLTHPQFLMVNLHQADRAGHYGDRDAYHRSVMSLDEELAGFWEWLQDQPAYAGDTWLFILADHGRHSDAATDPPWQTHGDECWGCRNVPLLVLGPGVRAGQTSGAPVLLTDLAPTFGALLDFEVPWAAGRVARELFTDAPRGAVRSGVHEVAAAGGRVVEVRYLDRTDRRYEVVVDGAVLSSPDAMVAEAVDIAADGERAWLCFRELIVNPGGDSPWVPRCFRDEGGGWEDIGAPEATVGPFWAPTLVPNGEELLVFYPRNPYGIASFGVGDNTVGVRAARWRDGRWKMAAKEAGFSFPSAVSAAVTDEGVHAAFSAGAGGVTARHDRKLYAASLTDLDEPEWGALKGLDPEGFFPDPRTRLEDPALHLGEDGVLRMAALVHSDQLTQVAIAALREGEWAFEALLEPEGYVLPHLAPVWHGERVVFPIIRDERGSAICAGTAEALECRATGPQRILDMALDGDTLHLVLDYGVGDWRRVPFAL